MGDPVGSIKMCRQMFTTSCIQQTLVQPKISNSYSQNTHNLVKKSSKLISKFPTYVKSKDNPMKEKKP